MTDDSKSPQIASTFLSILANPSTDTHKRFLNLQFPSSLIFIHVGMVHLSGIFMDMILTFILANFFSSIIIIIISLIDYSHK